MSLIEARAISRIYKTDDVEVAAPRDVSLAIDAREFVAFVGPSGSGKSTLLNLVGCLDHPNSGSLTVMGADVARLDRSAAAAFRGENLGFVFQEFKLVPVLSAYENVEYQSESDVTWIGELYRNGAGFDENQLATFYRLLDQAFSMGGGAQAQALAQSLAQAGYGRVNPGQRYAYLRASAKNPFDWLYFNPALTVIANLGDRSWQITPELL